ncbi:YncE family protein [Pantoea sp. BAV 3049]|uniref:7-bladed beta-propeller protein YncE n=1 Tax=Pantoea sp. BAV 3049 TaxID=2654188 RepID=UPI00131C0A62|nr:YncE family protein [Pantoea sp. BAV 3049]
MNLTRNFSGHKGRVSLLALALLASALPAHSETSTAPLRQPVAKGAYEMAYSPAENALYLATSQSRKLDKGGVVYRLDPQTLAVTQAIHNQYKPFGTAINNKTNVLYVGNTLNAAVTAIDVKTGDVKGSLILDNSPRTEDSRPLAPRELVMDEGTDTLYVAGVGKESKVWAVDGANLTLRHTFDGMGKYTTGLALDAAAKRLYITNGDNEFITIDTSSNKVLSRIKLAEDQQHFFLNIALDPATHRAFITDSKKAQLLVVDTQKGSVVHKIDVPESLAVLFNAQRDEVYVTHRDAGEVSVIDAKTYKVLRTIKAPTHPNSLALSPDGQTLYISVKQASTRKQEATAPDDVMRVAL